MACVPLSSLQPARPGDSGTCGLDFGKEEPQVCAQESLQGNQFQLQLEKRRRRKPRGSGREVMKNLTLAVNLSRLFFKGPTWLWLFSSGVPNLWAVGRLVPPVRSAAALD